MVVIEDCGGCGGVVCCVVVVDGGSKDSFLN
jgi:hypothetical protein